MGLRSWINFWLKPKAILNFPLVGGVMIAAIIVLTVIYLSI